MHSCSFCCRVHMDFKPIDCVFPYKFKLCSSKSDSHNFVDLLLQISIQLSVDLL